MSLTRVHELPLNAELQPLCIGTRFGEFEGELKFVYYTAKLLLLCYEEELSCSHGWNADALPWFIDRSIDIHASSGYPLEISSFIPIPCRPTVVVPSNI